MLFGPAQWCSSRSRPGAGLSWAPGSELGFVGIGSGRIRSEGGGGPSGACRREAAGAAKVGDVRWSPGALVAEPLQEQQKSESSAGKVRWSAGRGRSSEGPAGREGAVLDVRGGRATQPGPLVGLVMIRAEGLLPWVAELRKQGGLGGAGWLECEGRQLRGNPRVSGFWRVLPGS